MRAALAAAAAAAVAAAIYVRMQRRDRLRWVAAVLADSPYVEEALVAAALALECGAAIRRVDAARGSARAVWKDGAGGIDPVTETDEANERLVTETLRRKFPNHAIVGEEAAAAAGCVPEISPSVPTWVVDPLDGTQNFVHGVPLAVVSIGLCVGGVPAMGVVYHAAADELYVGAPSAGGAWLNGERIAPDGATALPEALVATDVGYERSAEGIQKLCATSAAVMSGNVRARASSAARCSAWCGWRAAATPPSTAACTSATAQSRGTGAPATQFAPPSASPSLGSMARGSRRTPAMASTFTRAAPCARARRRSRAPSARPSSAGSPTARGWWCRPFVPGGR